MLKQNRISASAKDVLLRNAAFAFMIGFLLYHLFPVPPIFWRVGLVVTSLVGLYFHLQRYRFTSVERSILGFLGVNIVYFFVSFLWQTPLSTNFGNVLCAILPIFLFFYLSARGAVTDKSLQIFLSIAAVAAVLYFFHAESLALMEQIRRESGEITNNASSIFLVLIPLLFFVKNKILFWAIIAECIFFILYGAKRGNVVASVIPLLLLLKEQYRTYLSWKSKLFTIIGFACLLAYTYHNIENNDYLVHRMEKTMEGDTSNRDRIYSQAWHAWADSNNIKNFVFGYGTDGTNKEIGIRAHNDWLEVIVDFGLIGVSFYLVFFCNLLRTCRKVRRWNKSMAYTLFSVLMIWFLKSLYSMGFTENLFSYLSMVMGIVLGRVYGVRCKIENQTHAALPAN